MKDFLESLPNTWFRKIDQKSIRGTPDYICCVNGAFVAMELKRSIYSKMRGTLQEYNINKINNDAGGIGLFVFPENWDNIKNMLKGISEERHYETYTK